MRSIRQYLSVQILFGSALVIVVGSLVLALAIRRMDIEEFDSALEAKARALATLVIKEEREIEVDFAGEYMPEFERSQDPEYFEFRFPNGSIIERSDSLGEQDLPFFPHVTGGPVFIDQPLPDGRKGRLVQISLSPRLGNVKEPGSNGSRVGIPESIDPAHVFVVLSVARSREGLDAMLRNIYAALAAMDAILLGMIILVVKRALRKGFHPITSMNEQISRLSPDALDKRVNLVSTPIEIETVLSALDGFMEKLQAAFVRERRFTSDVAHELRTPIAEFRAACDVGAKWSDDPDLVKKRFKNLQDSALNMERLVKDLLELSRFESGVVVVEKTEVPISALIQSSWTRLWQDAGQSERQLDNQIEAELTLKTDAVKLEILIQNLLNNAAIYSVSGTAITCTSSISSNGDRILSISNRSKELAREDLEHVFDRFWRKDSARTGGHHYGLGLSIVKSLADVLDIRVKVDLSEDEIFTINLCFPS